MLLLTEGRASFRATPLVVFGSMLGLVMHMQISVPERGSTHARFFMESTQGFVSLPTPSLLHLL